MKRFISIAAGLVLLSSCGSSSVAPLPDPPKVSILPTTTSIPDFSQVELSSVGGTTTTTALSMKGGRASLRGRVLVGGTAVEGATVRIDRFVNDKSVTIDVKSGSDGAYVADGLLGGRLRIRAFLPPTMTMTQSEVFFLNSDENKTLDLNLTKYESGLSVASNIAPRPPILGQSANLVAQVTTKGVDSAGTVRPIPAVGIQVTLITAGGRALASPSVVTTDSSGRATWALTCASLEKQGLTLALPDGGTSNLNLADCELPPPTTLQLDEYPDGSTDTP